jgi:hypothetical protein
MNRALWIVQGLTAAVFLLGGASKLAMPLDEMVEMSGLPGGLILFLGVVELLGAVGLILPGLLRIKTGLVPLAAAGLTIIMIGATILTAAGVGGGDAVMALFPLVIGILTAFVAYGRSQVRPHGQAARAERDRSAVQATA